MYTLNSTENHCVEVIENHPSDSRVRISTDGMVQTLSSRMGTGGGNVPMIMEEIYAETRSPILRLLCETYGEKAVIEWGIAILDTLQQAEVLRQGVHESSVSGETKNRDKLDDGTLPCPTVVAGWLLRDMWEREECGCPSQGRKSTEQRFEQFAESVSELSYKDTSSGKEMFDMWEKGQGLWILQQTLYQIQEIWKSSMREWKGGGLMAEVSGEYIIIRRLTPL